MKLDISRGSYGVRKYQYEQFDIVVLYIELIILVGCQLIGCFRPCTRLLKFVVDIFLKR